MMVRSISPRRLACWSRGARLPHGAARRGPSRCLGSRPGLPPPDPPPAKAAASGRVAVACAPVGGTGSAGAFRVRHGVEGIRVCAGPPSSRRNGGSSSRPCRGKYDPGRRPLGGSRVAPPEGGAVAIACASVGGSDDSSLRLRRRKGTARGKAATPPLSLSVRDGWTGSEASRPRPAGTAPPNLRPGNAADRKGHRPGTPASAASPPMPRRRARRPPTGSLWRSRSLLATGSAGAFRVRHGRVEGIRACTPGPPAQPSRAGSRPTIVRPRSRPAPPLHPRSRSAARPMSRATQPA